MRIDLKNNNRFIILKSCIKTEKIFNDVDNNKKYPFTSKEIKEIIKTNINDLKFGIKELSNIISRNNNVYNGIVYMYIQEIFEKFNGELVCFINTDSNGYSSFEDTILWKPPEQDKNYGEYII
jgi:hypothetical protein